MGGREPAGDKVTTTDLAVSTVEAAGAQRPRTSLGPQ
jgi:hypothetical protein